MAAQRGLAVVLVAGTGLMLRTLLRLYDRDPGIDVERLLALDVVIPDFHSRDRAAAVSDIELTAARALGLFGALALLLAAVGLHGVMARLVNDRRRELGIRIALGAEPRAVRWLVVGRTLRIALLGIVAGITASVLISRQLGALLHGVSAADPLVLAAASAVLLTVALVASYTPARRAARVDPLNVMKSE